MSARKLSSISDKSGLNLGQKVAEVLAQDLLNGVYPAGTMLPKETQIAQQMSLSRASVASGLLILTSLGMISRQAGRGTVVEETHEWKLLDPLLSRWIVEYGDPHQQLFKEIVDYRYGIEPYVSALAATRANAQDLAAIEAAYNQMCAGVKNEDQDALINADIEFHAAIYRATHNLIWSQSISVLQPAIRLMIRETNESADELNDSLQRHFKVLENIRLRKPAETFDAAINVLNRSAHDLGITRSAQSQDLLSMMKGKMLGPSN